MPHIAADLAGCKLFPVQPGGKLPALSFGWQTRATDNPAQLAEWDAAMSGLNWGVAAGTSGLFVFDIDPAGQAAWEALQDKIPGLREAVKRSYTVKTPRGGFHHYFRGSGPTTASAIAPGIDTRGGYLDEKTGKWKSLGFVVAPGSRTVEGPKTVNGEYVALGGSIEPMSAPVLQIVPEKKQGTVIGLDRSPNLDQPRNVQWATDLLTNYVKEGRVSIEGAGGNNTAFQVAASILDKAISPARAFELMDELWNPHCSPAWEDWELQQIVANAAQYGEDTGDGSKGFQDNASAFEKFVGYEVPAEMQAAAEAKRKRFEPMWLKDARMEKREARWLVPGLIPDMGTGILYGLSGSYKTFVALDLALSLAHGIGGQWGCAPVKHTVVFLAGESRFALQQERVDSWCEWQGLNPDDANFILVPGVPSFSDKEGWEEIRDWLATNNVKPDLFVIDTLTRLMSGLDENSNNDAKVAIKHCEDISAHYGCFTLSTGHTGKDESRGVRGAQVFIDNSDAVIYAKKTNMGTKLQVKKLKETDIPDQPLFLEKKEFGKSIVLVRTEQASGDADGGGKSGSKISWSNPEEITKILSANGGRMGHKLMVQEISGANGNIDRTKVDRELKNRQDIQWLKEGDYWRVPTDTDAPAAEGQEFDL